MNSQNFTLAENLIPSSYVQQAASALRTRENLAKTLMEQVCLTINGLSIESKILTTYP